MEWHGVAGRVQLQCGACGIPHCSSSELKLIMSGPFAMTSLDIFHHLQDQIWLMFPDPFHFEKLKHFAGESANRFPKRGKSRVVCLKKVAGATPFLL